MATVLETEGSTPGGRVRLEHPSGACVELARFGAHILSWQTPAATPGAPAVERLWMSKLSAMDGSAPIRGGIPIAWPQFADVGSMPLHGFARERVWSVGAAKAAADASDEATLEMRLAADEATTNGTWRNPAVAAFPHTFELTLKIGLTASALTLQLSAKHLGPTETAGDQPLAFTGCLHTYFRTADSTQVRVGGEGAGSLRGHQFVDKVDGFKTKQHGDEDGGDALVVEKASLASSGYVDRVYTPPAIPATETRTIPLAVGTGLDASKPEQAHAYTLELSGSWPDVVIFNPWLEGKKGDKGPDFDDDGYKYMICVEPTIASAPICLATGADWVGTCRIVIDGTD